MLETHTPVQEGIPKGRFSSKPGLVKLKVVVNHLMEATGDRVFLS